MKNLKKAELIVIALTLICLIFTAGYFVGRGSAVQIISFDKLAAVSVSVPEGNDTTKDNSGSNTDASDTDVSHADVFDVPQTPISDPSASAGITNPGTSEKININTASSAKLEELPGIGPVLAQNIIEYREKIGGFKSIEQIMDVDGIGEKKFDAMKNMIRIG